MKTTRATRPVSIDRTYVHPQAARVAMMKPGQRDTLLVEPNGDRFVLERAPTGRTGRIVRESSKGFEVIRSIKF